MSARRSFLTRFGIAAAAFGLSAAPSQAQSTSDVRWQPARDPKDDWFDQVPGKHRLFFDALTPQGASQAQTFAGNFFEGNKSGYGLENTEVAVVICLRHMSTPLAYGDALWAKYGAALGDAIKLTDAKTGQTSLVNTHRAALEGLAKRGVHFAVCDMATHHFASAVARNVDGDADAIYKEMVASAIPNAHFVAAGIIAVNRSQERGYSIAYVG
jgi:intracellular sulfur oxidation DsrE/DsrF family protein